MSYETYRYCNHRLYGVGSAQFIKFRRQEGLNLWMVEFQSRKRGEKYFFVEREFIFGEDIEFIDDAAATELYKQGRKSSGKRRGRSIRKEQETLTDFLDSLF